MQGRNMTQKPGYEELEKRFRGFFNNARFYGYIISPEGRLLDINTAALEMLGYAREELVGQPLSALYAEESIEKAEAIFRNFRKTGQARGEELVVKTKSGERRWVVLNADAVRDESGQIIYSTCVHVDITDRKSVDEALRKSEAKLRAMIEASRLAVVLIDRDGCVLESNAEHAARLNLTREQLLGKCVWDLLPESVRAHRKKKTEEVFATGIPFFGEDKRDGVWIEYSIQPAIRNPDGDIEAVVVEAQIVNDRKALEERLWFMSSITEKLSDSIMVTDTDFRIIYCNPASEKLFGYTEKELIGKRPDVLNAEPAGSTLQNQIYQKIATGETFLGEALNKRKDGSTFFCEFKVMPLTDEKGRIFAHAGLQRDVSDRKALENHLQNAQRMEALGTLAGGIAHDFNNILFPIIGMSELLVEDHLPGSREHENLYEILKAGRRGSDLVKQILAFSRQAEHSLAPVRVQKILREVLDLVRKTIPANIRITQNIQNDCRLVMADPTQVHQVAMNLLINAYHAVEPAGGDIFVALEERALDDESLKGLSVEAGRYVMFSVSDTGCGIGPADMDKIFEPYFTTKTADKGTGLGLAVVYGIVKEHGGDIRVHSEPGEGTIFQVCFPLMDQTGSAEDRVETIDFRGGTERILVVDDERPVAHIEKQILERLGYDVTLMLSSDDALDRFRQTPGEFDLVISDMSMPKMTGDRLARELISIRPDVPVIICTGFSEKIDKNKAINLGVKGFLMKPVVKSEMARMVRKVLDESCALGLLKR